MKKLDLSRLLDYVDEMQNFGNAVNEIVPDLIVDKKNPLDVEAKDLVKRIRDLVADSDHFLQLLRVAGMIDERKQNAVRRHPDNLGD